jgi:hypothetical protein
MAQDIVYLHGQPESVAHYLRLGTLHRQIETCSVQAECRWIEWLSRRRTSERLDRMDLSFGSLAPDGRNDFAIRIASAAPGPSQSVCLGGAVVACPRL